MSEENTKSGMFGWNELNTNDAEGAKKFYTEVFGWEAATQQMGPDMEYTMFSHGGEMVAGLVNPGCDAPPHWMSYISSEDLAADVEKVKAAGGTILVDAMEVPETGIFSVVKDPQGAVFSLWQSTSDC